MAFSGRQPDDGAAPVPVEEEGLKRRNPRHRVRVTGRVAEPNGSTLSRDLRRGLGARSEAFRGAHRDLASSRSSPSYASRRNTSPSTGQQWAAVQGLACGRPCLEHITLARPGTDFRLHPTALSRDGRPLPAAASPRPRLGVACEVIANGVRLARRDRRDDAPGDGRLFLQPGA